MSTNSSSIPSDGRGRQALLAEAYEIAIIDCGCWDNQNRYFGAMNGSVAILARMNDHSEADAARRCRSNGDGTTGECNTPRDCAVPLYGLSEADRIRLRELAPLLIQFLWQLVRVGPGGNFSVEVLDAPYVAFPVVEEEAHKRGELLSPASELSIFLPDMHLGILDAADDFAQKSTVRSVQIENLEVLRAVVETATTLGAKIYQMGDFLDIWEVEACLHEPVYFGKELSSVTLRDAAGPDGRSWYEDRQRRAMQAEALILQRWAEVGGESFRLLRAHSGIQWIHGNHDIEAGAQGGALESAPRPEGDVGHWFFGPDCHQSVWKEGAWAAEHGHYFDLFNDTKENRDSLCLDWTPSNGSNTVRVIDGVLNRQRGPRCVPEVLDLVPGKSVTYSVARDQRNESVPRLMTDDHNRPYVEIHDPSDRGMVALGMPQNWPRLERAAGDVVASASFQPYTYDGAERLERAGFQDMRFRLLDSVYLKVSAMNPEVQFSSGIRYQAANRGEINFYFGSESESGNVYHTFYFPRRIPFRVLFHGHTHQPMIFRIRVFPTLFPDLTLQALP